MLTLEFVPYAAIEGLSSIGRIKKLLKVAKENKIVLLEGRLEKEEEAELIKTTMEEIDDEFKGIELAVVDPQGSNATGMEKMKLALASKLLGNRQGLTIIGPASIVKEIKKDPNKIQLLTEQQEIAKRKKKK
ncbi:hypothetical protein C0585_03140 [Candidatus Woesearchaeota archaeon]|nr:MAG: hypothetical protein C0585_03140 [Candidatus Woesearchaeota archaeon]